MPSTTVPTSDAEGAVEEHNIEAATAVEGLESMHSPLLQAQGAAARPTAAAAAGAAGPPANAGLPAPAQQQEQHERQLQLAVLLLDRGRFRDTAAALQPLLAAQPRHVAALCLQGRCLAAIGSRPEVRGRL